MHWIRELPDPCLNSFLNFYVRRFSRFGPQYRGSPNLEAWTSWAPSVVNNYVTRSLLGRSHLCKYEAALPLLGGLLDGSSILDWPVVAYIYTPRAVMFHMPPDLTASQGCSISPSIPAGTSARWLNPISFRPHWRSPRSTISSSWGWTVSMM